ncbi:uncharacterized protein FTOL_09732 [Fusarium torulosum]|uniref:Uncharacterized protein n=1 Tax=Fusarium torulosum TaxID=33205 RepID=A0AAE8SLM8_9HYPO|nr:uncharacterized protein FTOL_09732 [Fusarium torulosum]
MPSNVFLSMAVGLIGLNSVVAGPCKPLASTYSLASSATEISSSSTAESIATETSTSTESLVSETVTSTVIAATTTDFSSTLSTTATSADTTTLYTTETSADSNVLTTTLTLSETTAAETTTATSEAPAEPTGFFIVAGPGAALGKKLETSEFPGGPTIFNADRADVFEPRRFVLDDSTGRLQRNGLSLCANFSPDSTNTATITQCDTESYYYGTSYLTCGQSAAPGSTLRCSSAKLDCVPHGPSGQRCTEVTEPGPAWNGQFYIDTSDDGESYLSVGADNLGGRYSPVDLYVNFVVAET